MATEKSKPKNIITISSTVDDIVMTKHNYDLKNSHNYGFPTLILHVHYPEYVMKYRNGSSYKEPPHESCYYLTPFRLYDFQISGTLDGDGDYGSSPVIGLCNLMAMTRDNYELSNLSWNNYISTTSNALHPLMKGQAMLAIYGFQKYNKRYGDGFSLDFYRDHDHAILRHGDVLDQFISICQAYILNYMGRESEIDREVLYAMQTLAVVDEDTGESDPLWRHPIKMDLLEEFTSDNR